MLEAGASTPYKRWSKCTMDQESPADAVKPARRKSMQNCSNSTCFVSFHRIPFPRISKFRL